MNTPNTTKRGRPPGSKHRDWQPLIVAVPRCAHCGSTEHTRLILARTYHVANGETRPSPADGGPFNVATYHKSYCRACRQPFPLVVRYRLTIPVRNS